MRPCFLALILGACGPTPPALPPPLPTAWSVPEPPPGEVARGAALLRAPLYRNVAPPGAGEALDAALPAAVIALASGSAARHLAALGRDLGGARIAAIGPSTARVCRELGLEVSAVADPHTAAGLAAAIRGLIRQ